MSATETAPVPETQVEAAPAVLQVTLIDLSSIAYPIWHMSQSEPDPNTTSTRIVERVRALATGQRHVAVCCDSGRSFRRDLDPTYKANRPAQDAALYHQIDVALDRLRGDGFPIWRADGCEADDVIASATVQALMSSRETRVVIVTGDKDLLQLVDERVQVKSVRDGSPMGLAEVKLKLGVEAHQVLDYLTLVGDSSDNVRGCDGIGPKTAEKLLRAYGSLDAMFAAFDKGATPEVSPGLRTKLQEFRPRVEGVRALLRLKMDVDVPFAEIAREREPQDVQDFFAGDEADAAPEQEPSIATPVADVASPAAPAPAATPEPSPAPQPGPVVELPTAMVVRPPVEFERALEPMNMRDAKELAGMMFQSRMFSAYGTPQAVLSAVMVGRELGLPAMASLRSIHVVEGRHTLSASLMVALVLKSGLAEYFRPVSFDDQQATFETRRKGEGNHPIRVTHTIAMAQQAGLVKPNSNWVKVPTDMLVARAQSRLARLVYPDVLGGLYTPDELSDMRGGGNGGH